MGGVQEGAQEGGVQEGAQEGGLLGGSSTPRTYTRGCSSGQTEDSRSGCSHIE